ncbi:alpha/beta hydrolase [Sphingobacterium wenxiniae]|uniref:Predicted hydrolase of the alpha/beta superfamily n=1 Tax=Sphingobacterium wenxiniae TaxID=683125 RepID=A0A1I6NR28_9SPHI|nr:alpha/beta hydrolase-fold protein [Sphingobacterium wenxiniae]SFS30462.1 Predicted hydrolase of the alpha/beta superfamily [Sphingobacterium wenxiniae]
MSKETFTVTVHVHNNSESFIGETCYLASNVHRWQADGLPIGAIPTVGENLQVTLNNIPAGELELKLTRGSWETLHCGQDGHLLPAHEITVQQDSEVHMHIDAWRDEFSASTASPQVSVLDERFYFPRLNVYRKIWLYLPQDYYTSGKRYPVLYMHDGQHLFDEAFAVGRSGPVEWMVDETIDSSAQACIVIGIEHPTEFSEREKQYIVHPYKGIEQSLGWSYLQDIVEVVKAYVDNNFRTLQDREHTGMVGSSLGGLLSLYAGLQYPEHFGVLGVFSPSIWVGKDELHHFFAQAVERHSHLLKQQRYYFYAGEKEIKRMGQGEYASLSKDMQEFIQFADSAVALDKAVDIDPKGKHGAFYWQGAFRRFYAGLPKEFFN